MTAIMFGLTFDAIIRSAPSKDHLAWLFRAHANKYNRIVRYFQLGVVLNLLQVTFIVEILYGKIEAIGCFVVFAGWLGWMYINLYDTLKARAVIIAATAIRPVSDQYHHDQRPDPRLREVSYRYGA